MADAPEEIVEKIEKLLRLAAVNPNENEAAAATAKAQELLAAYNLDLATIEENRDGGGKRVQENYEGGRDEWQRDLWSAVAKLNFCIYFNEPFFLKSRLGNEVRLVVQGDVTKRVRGFWRRQHRICGRKVNASSTYAMASYLEEVCDRITKERVRATNERSTGKWAMSFREGMSARLIGKIYDRRQQLLDEEQRKHFEAMKRASESNLANAGSSSTALTLSTYSQSERDANIDFLHGEGTSAKWAEERARQAAAKRAADEEYTRWAAAHPKQAAREEARAKARREREAERANRRYFKGKKTDAWVAGYDAAEGVSLDQQTEGIKTAGYLK